MSAIPTRRKAAKPVGKTPAKGTARYADTTAKRARFAVGEAAPAVPAVKNVYVRMGELLGQRIASEADVLALVREGLPARVVQTLSSELALNPELVAPQSTLRRRVERDQPLSVDESERMIRIARITSLAESLYADPAQARAWLARPGGFVAGAAPISPLELVRTESGARIIEAAILRVMHGML